MKIARKMSTRRRPIRKSPSLSLSARVERLEKAVLWHNNPLAAAKTPRFATVHVPGESKHVAVFDSTTGLTWTADIIGEASWEDAKKIAAACTLLGHKDWRLPTIQELLSIVDYDRYDPAVDPDFFRGPYGWTWSGTSTKAPSGCAWGVNLGNGDSYRGGQGSRDRVRAVRAGQSLSLGL